MQISVSYLTSFYSKEKTINLITKTTADYLHADLMDGLFVANKNFNINEIVPLLKETKIPLDIHLMVLDPIIYIPILKELKPEYITFHLEATKDVIKTIQVLKEAHIKVGLSLKPETEILELMPYLSFIDLVLVMSVEPGAGGQEFLPNTPERLKTLLNYREKYNLNFKIEVDGGINNNTISLIKEADIAVVGSYICKAKNYELQITKLKNIINDIDYLS